MPRFPVYDRSQGLSGGSTGSFASAGSFSAPGRALQGAGEAAQGVGGVVTAKVYEYEAKVKNSLDDSWFSKARAETAMEMQRFNREASQSATGGADGHVDNVRTHLQEVREQYLDGAPSDRARQLFDSWSFEEDARQTTNAAKFQADAALAGRASNLTEAMAAHSRAILDDPSQYETVRARALDDLEGAKQWMTPEQETLARENTTKILNESYHKARIKADPVGAARDLGVGKINAISFLPVVENAIATAAQKHGVSAKALRVIAQLESRGDPNAQNPNSSAGGLFQFIDSTAADYGLKNKKDPGSAADAGARLLRDNMASLRKSLGREPTTAELYLAHQQGADGAAKLLANPNASAASIVGAKAVSLNGGKPGMTAQQFANIWLKKANDLAGDNSPTNFANDPRMAGMDAGDILSLQQSAENELASLIKSQKAANTAALADVKGAFQLGIATGDNAVTHQSILSSPLDDADKAQLINSLDTAQKDKRTTAEYASKLDMGAALDPYDSKDQKGVGLVYDAMTGGADVVSDQKAQNALNHVYSKSGVVPSTAVNQLRRGLGSQEADRVGAAAAIAARLYDEDPNGLSAAPNGSELEKAAISYRHLADNLGYSHEDAGKQLLAMNDPEKRREREALLDSEPVKKAVKEISADTIASAVDPEIFGFSPDFRNQDIAAFAVAEYRDLFKDNIVKAAGDVDLANEMTKATISKRYGVSKYISAGDEKIVRYPVEATYGTVDGSHEWIREQLESVFRASGYSTDYDPVTGETPEKSFDAGKIYLEPSIETEHDVKAGVPPRYLVSYESGGVLYQYPGFFVPDHKSAATAKSDAAMQAQKESSEQAKYFRKNPPDVDWSLGAINPQGAAN